MWLHNHNKATPGMRSRLTTSQQHPVTRMRFSSCAAWQPEADQGFLLYQKREKMRAVKRDKQKCPSKMLVAMFMV